jgi:hypothetical protein
MQLSGAFFTLLLMLGTVRLLARRVAIFDELAAIASFEAIAVIAARGALQHILLDCSTHHKNY